MIDRLKRKRLIFTITTGRSGSGYLAGLLNMLPGVLALHEPKPLMSDAYQKIRRDPKFAREWWMDRKLPEIATRLAQDLHQEEIIHTYIETAHLFCKGFMESFVNIATQYEIPFDLIILTRPMHEVAQSMYELNTIPGKTQKGKFWYITPGEPGCLTRLPGWSTLHDYQICFWYTLEIHERIYQAMVADWACRKIIIQMHDIKYRDRFKCFLDALDLKQNDNFWDLWKIYKDTKINTKSSQKQHKPLSEEYRLKLETEVRERTIIKGGGS